MTTGLESQRSMPTRYLAYSSVFTRPTRTPELALDWQSAKRSFIATADESGWSPKEKAKAPRSTSLSPERTEDPDPVNRRPRILLAEDNPADVLLVREAFEHHGLDVELVVKRDGEEMLRLLDRMEAGELPCPDVVLLDLTLPRRNGIEVLRQIRQGSRCGKTPVIIVTSSDALKDRESVAQLGATSYFRKPSSFDEFMRLGKVVNEVIEQSTKTP